MTNEFAARLKAVDQTILTPLVRQALEDDTVEVVDWDYKPIQGGISAEIGWSYGIYRFSGFAQAQNKTVTWSLVLKATGASTAASRAADGELQRQQPSDHSYWKREVLVFQSGLLDELSGDLVVPRCFGVDEYPGQEFWIWLEDIPQEESSSWSLERYGLAARHLGQFNGAYFVGQPLPEASWLSTGRVRPYLAEAEPTIRDLHNISEHPLGQRWLTGDIVDRILQLWADQDMMLEAFDRLPRSLCHHDAFRRNLMTRRGTDGRDQTVAIDWETTGIGVIGEEIAPLFVQSLQFFEAEMSKMVELDRIVFEGYLDGLRDVGWHGNPQMVRFGYAATAALFTGIGWVGIILPWAYSDEGRKLCEKIFGYPIEHIFEQWAELQHYLLDLGDEARELRDILA